MGYMQVCVYMFGCASVYRGACRYVYIGMHVQVGVCGVHAGMCTYVWMCRCVCMCVWGACRYVYMWIGGCR